MQKTWNDARELAVAIEERVLCGHQRIVLTPSTALWIARQIQGAVARQNAPRPPISKFGIDLYATGSCVMQVDTEADILEVVAWARNSIAARAAFEELCRLNPEKSYHQRRKSWVEAERMVKPARKNR